MTLPSSGAISICDLRTEFYSGRSSAQITKLYKPKDQRPLKFTGNKEESKLFLISNKIIT